MGLRERLIAAKLAGTKAEDGAHTYLFRDNETAALVAVDEVARWLREEAAYLLVECGDGEARLIAEALNGRAYVLERSIAADSITGSTDG